MGGLNDSLTSAVVECMYINADDDEEEKEGEEEVDIVLRTNKQLCCGLVVYLFFDCARKNIPHQS